MTGRTVGKEIMAFFYDSEDWMIEAGKVSYAYVSPDAVYLRGEDATTFTFDGQQATYYEKETGLYDFHAR